MGVAVLHARPRVEIDFAEVDVVPQPQHGIGRGIRDAFEDAVTAPVGLARPVKGRFVDEDTGTDRHGEGRWIEAVLPEGLGCEALEIRVEAGLGPFTIHQHLESVGGARGKSTEVENGGIGRCPGQRLRVGDVDGSRGVAHGIRPAYDAGITRSLSL